MEGDTSQNADEDMLHIDGDGEIGPECTNHERLLGGHVKALPRVLDDT
jgi:hypothetical protein